jgi:hypothetical protein
VHGLNTPQRNRGVKKGKRSEARGKRQEKRLCTLRNLALQLCFAVLTLHSRVMRRGPQDRE